MRPQAEAGADFAGSRRRSKRRGDREERRRWRLDRLPERRFVLGNLAAALS
jgi:hypothetical protein